MPFVQRNPDGTVTGVYAVAQPGYAEELLADDDPALVEYRTRPTPPRGDSARLAAIEAALVEKAVVTEAEIDAKETEVTTVDAGAKWVKG